MTQEKYKDKIGTVVGKLTLIKQEGFFLTSQGYKDPLWICKCSCGIEKVARHSLLFTKNHIQSCGCLRLERIKNNQFNKSHGGYGTKLYKIWKGMKDRCSYNTEKNKHYAGKGIVICKEWKDSYENFKEWANNNGYEEGLSIDRINVNGNYCPSNCRFVSMKIQQNNKTNNRLITAWGETKTLTMWSEDERCKVKRSSLSSRLHMGWEVERAISTPPRSYPQQKN